MKIRTFLLLALLAGCEPTPEPLGVTGGKCKYDYTCQPGLQCQVTRNSNICIPIGKEIP